MHQAISAFTRDSVPCPTPDDVADALRYVASDSFAAKIAVWEREDIRRYSAWIAMEAADPALDIIGDLAAHQISRRPAIVWG